MALPLPETRHTTTRRPRYSSTRNESAERIILTDEDGFTVEAFKAKAGWIVRSGEIQVPAQDQRGAERILSSWHRTRICPVPLKYQTRTRSA